MLDVQTDCSNLAQLPNLHFVSAPQTGACYKLDQFPLDAQTFRKNHSMVIPLTIVHFSTKTANNASCHHFSSQSQFHQLIHYLSTFIRKLS